MNELISTRLKTRRGGKHSYSPPSSSQEGFTQINNNHEYCPTHLTFLSVVELGLNRVYPSLSGSGPSLIKICRKSRGLELVLGSVTATKRSPDSRNLPRVINAVLHLIEKVNRIYAHEEWQANGQPGHRVASGIESGPRLDSALAMSSGASTGSVPLRPCQPLHPSRNWTSNSEQVTLQDHCNYLCYCRRVRS